MLVLLFLLLDLQMHYEDPAAAAEACCINRCFNVVTACKDDCRVTDPVNPEERMCLDTCVEAMMGCVNECWSRKDDASN